MTRFGQSEMVIARNQLSLFAPKSDRDIPGQIGTNRDILPPADAPQPGQSGTPPLKGGVQCPAGTGVGMSRSRPGPAEGITNRNESKEGNFDPARNYPTPASIKAAFDQWTADGQPWPPPAGLTSAIADRLIPRPGCHRRAPQHGKRWR
jgi:hypothetical protein